MDNFRKYKSIENSYNVRFVKAMLQKYDLNNKIMIATEKLDGANLQLLFTPSGEMKVGKRSQWLEKDEQFFDVWNTIEKYPDILKKISQRAFQINQDVRVYGELYGNGINNRVNYGPEQYIKFFDLWDGDIQLTPAQAKDFFGEMYVPIIAQFLNLTETLSINPSFLSKLGSSNSEGFVVRPLDENIYENNDAVMFKVKAKEFAELEQVKSKVKSLNKYDISLMDLNLNFISYVNHNRLLSVISKEGPITQTAQIGKYIKLILEDALIDFKKDNDLSSISEKDQKFILNCGKHVADLVKSELARRLNELK